MGNSVVKALDMEVFQEEDAPALASMLDSIQTARFVECQMLCSQSQQSAE